MKDKLLNLAKEVGVIVLIVMVLYITGSFFDKLDNWIYEKRSKQNQQICNEILSKFNANQNDLDSCFDTLERILHPDID